MTLMCKSKVKENLKVWEWKINVWIEIDNVFLNSLSKIYDSHMPNVYTDVLIAKTFLSNKTGGGGEIIW
jgi:hypothetical protein